LLVAGLLVAALAVVFWCPAVREAVRDPSGRDAANPRAADGGKCGRAWRLARNPQYEPQGPLHEARQELQT
jgi:predicted exporter